MPAAVMCTARDFEPPIGRPGDEGAALDALGATVAAWPSAPRRLRRTLRAAAGRQNQPPSTVGTA